MLPNVTLKAVSRDDVDRVAWWLEDEEVSSQWFGHYGCGEPVHRGYDPNHMLESSDWEWQSVFDDPHRRISSIYTDEEEHVGECQVLLDGEDGAELSLLIGRKDLWHRGYGTATVLMLLDQVFKDLDVKRAWVNVPDGNEPALGLFENLGFDRRGERELCMRSDGTALRASILAIDTRTFQVRRPGEERGPVPASVLVLTGLPGSGSEAIGADVAKLLGCRVIDDEITDMMCRRMRCSAGEIDRFESSHASFWSRMLNSIVLPIEWSATYDAGYHLFRRDRDYDVLKDVLTRERYLKGLASVVKEVCAQGQAVLHGHGSHAVIPASADAVSVFVTASAESRGRRIALDLGMGIEEADKWRKQADAETFSISNHLLGTDLRDMGQFDITVNADRLSTAAAAELVFGALQAGAVRQRSAKDVEVAEETAV